MWVDLGIVRNLVPSLTGNLVYGGSALVDLNGLMSYHDSAKQDAIPGYSITSGSLWQAHVPNFSYVGGGLAWTSQGTHATATFSSTHWNYYSAQTSGVALGDVVSLSLDAKFPASNACTNLVFAHQDSGTLAKSFSAADGINTATCTTIIRLFSCIVIRTQRS